MIIFKIGLLGGNAVDVSVTQGIYYFIAALPIAFGGLFSAIKQGEVAAAGIKVLAKRATGYQEGSSEASETVSL